MEIWKDIVGYEGIYQVSNYGNVKSLDRIDCRGHKIGGRIISHSKDGGGYHNVKLAKNGNVKTCHVHRLVAEAFIDNPDDKPTVNHINENKDDNTVNNLEWMTYKENAHHGTRMERCYGNRDYKAIGENISDSLKKKGRTKPIIQYDKDMNVIAEFDSAVDAAKKYNILASGIGNALKGHKRCKTYKGYIWKYKEAL